MKRIGAYLLIAAILFSFAGCGRNAQSDGDRVQFYYLRSTDAYIYGASDGVITSETRDSSAQSVGASYLLSLYLMGPLDESLRSPFPEGSAITNLVHKGNELSVVINSNFSTLKDMDQTLACVCLAKTCVSITGAEVIHIYVESFSGQVNHIETITLNSLMLKDSIISTENPS